MHAREKSERTARRVNRNIGPVSSSTSIHLRCSTSHPAITMAPRFTQQCESSDKQAPQSPVHKAANKRNATPLDESHTSTEESSQAAPAPHKRRRRYQRPKVDISYCPPPNMSSFARTCKRFHPIGTEALFKTLDIELSNIEPCKTIEKFCQFVNNLHFTRELKLEVSSSPRSQSRFQIIIGFVKKVPLRSLEIRGELNKYSYSALDKVLNDPVDGCVLRSQLRVLELPKSSTKDVEWAREGRRSKSTNESFG